MASFTDRFVGTVTAWNREDGLGEVELPDGRKVWVHYAVVESGGGPGAFRSLNAGSAVSITVERADQDGYQWRATHVRGGVHENDP